MLRTSETVKYYSPPGSLVSAPPSCHFYNHTRGLANITGRIPLYEMHAIEATQTKWT